MRFLFVLLFFAQIISLQGQQLQAGFDPEEYLELMHVSIRTAVDSAYASQFPPPSKYQLAYQSDVIGLQNLWELWKDEEGKTGVISIRGTTQNPVSWLENFYSGMVPASGSLQLSKDFSWDYHLADHPRAAVHVGWLIATAYIAAELMPMLENSYQEGTRDFLLIGHSQGGGIGYLLTAYLLQQQRKGLLPEDIRFKTYCSAAPKPGNLYFAYDYESMTFGGWGFNVVNSYDWVPQVPFSIQTVDDFTDVNPFKDAKSAIKKQKFPNRIVMRRPFNQLDRPTRKAQRNFSKYLGNKATKIIQKSLPEFQKPNFVNSNQYVRTGTTVVLRPDESYLAVFPDEPGKFFNHHYHKPYMDLTRRQFQKKSE
jgi:hypothetical protein